MISNAPRDGAVEWKEASTMAPKTANNRSLPALSNAEGEVMKPCWERGPMAARDLYAALPDGHGWAYKTVKTLLSRLVAKGALEYDQIGNSYLYRPACSREQLTRAEMKGFIERILDGSLSPILAHFIEREHLSDDEIARLRAILDRRDGKKRPRNARG
jgi:predicted transcriptional regulator